MNKILSLTISLLTFIILISSCTSAQEINFANCKSIGEKGGKGLISETGELLLDTVYQEIRILNSRSRNSHYILYEKKNKNKGIYLYNLSKPIIEVDSTITFLDLMRSSDKYFAFSTDKRSNNYPKKKELLI